MFKRFQIGVFLAALLLLLSGQVMAREETEPEYNAPMLEHWVECVGRLDAVPYSSPSEYVSLEEAVVEVRNYLCQREPEFCVYVQFDSLEILTEDQLAGMVLDTYYSAMAHTGVPTEGDYLLWHWNGLRYGYGGQYVSQDGFYTYYFSFVYAPTYLSSAQQEAQMDTAVAQLLENLSLDGLTDYQKICAIYDYMTNNIIYDYDGLEAGTDQTHYTAYGALIEGEAVCQGYASLFYRLALSSGVDARVISGDAGGPHGWNIVGFDGLYYNLDSTWDAANPRYGAEAAIRYFLKNPAGFSDHVRNEEYDTAEFHQQYPMSVINYDYTMTQALIHRYSGSVPVAAFYEMDTAAAETGAGQYLRMIRDMPDANAAELAEDLYLDLNGHLVNCDFTGNGGLYILDSATDQYTCYDQEGTLTCGRLNGSAENLKNGKGERTCLPGTNTVRRYVALPTGEDTLTFHRIYLAITHLSLVPDKVSLGYKALFHGDEMVSECLESYGYNLWVSVNGQDGPVTRAQKSSFENGKVLTLRLDNMLSDREDINEVAVRASVQADVFMEFQVDGERFTVAGIRQSTTLKDMLEQLDLRFLALKSEQQTALRKMYGKFSEWMEGWNISNIAGT